jgi:SAM-dependent methyltransferase
VRVFKNGNAHLWFLRDDLVDAANKVLADYYGAVLPDAVPDDVTGDAVRSYALSRDLAFYPTPDAVIAQMLQHVRITVDSRVLEPSAGDGAIVDALVRAGAAVEAVEVHPGRVAALERRHRHVRVVEANFLQLRVRPEFSHVLMNPPFCGTHWMAHVRHAYDALAPGGRLVSVLPVSAELGETKKHAAFRAWVESCGGRFYDLPPESFAASGTRINTVLLVMGAPR